MCSLLILPLLILVACQPAPDSNTAAFMTAETSVIPAPTIAPISTEKTVIQIDTSTPLATSIPSTATSVPSPIPTLSLVEKETIASELYNTNANCKLPCWWGIVPGETEWQTAKSFLGALATKISTGIYSESAPEFIADVDIPVTEDLSAINMLRQYFSVQDGVIELIQPETPPTMPFTIISEILSTYGLPSEVWLDTYGYSYGELDPFRLVLFYPEKGILARYFDDAEFEDDDVVGCFSNHTGAVVLWSPDLKLTFAEALNGTRALGTFGDQYYKPLQEATDMDVETFYQIYLDPNTETCIETPAELWMDR